MEFVSLTKTQHLAEIALDRPEKYNCFNRQMALELQTALDDCQEDEEVRAVYLTGTGKAFCSGQDLQEVTAEDAPSFSTILSEHFNPIIIRLRELEKPVVCAVNGVAAGAGANIALACDLTVAAESSSFIQAFCKIGLIPDSGGTFFLPRLVGWQRAAGMMLLGDPLPAKEAERIGMIYATYPDDSFAEESKALAQRLAAMPTKALAMTKRALNYSMFNNELEKQLAIEEQLQSTAGLTEDYQEGVRAFLEKRKPVFKGK
ncbi:enoyl-CoA hydratase-related protein [Flavilitoribacter nigricans]|uniref:2-(1,2-epoxy-1,2-dihydrophenyl)acetyl-CoA isomerase n=1 Tax=Flavilitoribacter nigricans (strain ATCC 23147 / DSM 23189 / NBRC 102662 / NCIMB 1420 / SS-2) TaxID=1122177 RepID=A0A2D0N7M7_FLAN2|nr:enoyl-CoA hydratase-related protein [Flavilitoribacter nigricans]PHN04477.1 2-(1,2-epoxy-1,2-dihydrophenyl)acetyl-CoA isomerase [Flavilitoribacter nigricans DSM 23189 = NBRC 102662]